jgi:hypothetical protein
MELLFADPPEVDWSQVLRELESEFGRVDFKPTGDSSKLFFIPALPVDFADAQQMPAQIAVLSADPDKSSPPSEEVLAQSWATPNAAELASQTKRQLICTELMSSGLSYPDRHRLVRAGVRAVVRASNCIGLVATRTQQVLDRTAFLEAEDPLFGFINVRFFNAGDQGMVMDSLGLSALGLFDVQCHFTELEPNRVASVVHSVARYIFESEPEFENGHTVEGLDEQPWQVQFENALVGPDRMVLDLNPGPPFAVRR